MEDEFDDREAVQKLFQGLKEMLPRLRVLLMTVNGPWVYEDMVYRYYHHSFKVYGLQGSTERIVEMLRELLPEADLNPRFLRIVKEGTGKTWKPEDNVNWDEVTRPIVEAFLHARFFLEMAVRYGTELEGPPNMLPSGWAAFLYLYNLR